MTPTRRSALATVAALAVVVGVGGGLVIDGLGDALPRVPPSSPAVLAMFAAILLALALTTRSRLRALRERRAGAAPPRPLGPSSPGGSRPRGARELSPLVVARYAVLAKASSPVGAGVAGLYAGYALFLLPDVDVPGRGEFVLAAALAALAAGAVVAAALFLEHVCRLPADGPPGLPNPRTDRSS